jgi:hypothetical protein
MVPERQLDQDLDLERGFFNSKKEYCWRTTMLHRQYMLLALPPTCYL